MTAATNVHILGFLSERVADIRNLNELLLIRETNDVTAECETRSSLKRKLAMISCRRRTASQKRYKLPRLKIRTKKRRKLLSSVGENQPRCRQESRNRSIMMKLHSISDLESDRLSSLTNQKLTTRWLETHYWHRKRFFMKLCWGYCLPFHHKARGKKFLHSAVETSAVIHDSSYIRPIEISGCPVHIAELLQQFTDPSINLIRTNNDGSNSSNVPSLTQSQSIETQILLYRRYQFPSSCLGPGSLFICPNDENNADFLKVWIWCHPAIYSEIFDEVLSANKIAGNSCEINTVLGGIQRFSVRGQESLSLLGKVLHTVNTSNINQYKNCDTSTCIQGKSDNGNDNSFSNGNFFLNAVTRPHQCVTAVWGENVPLGIIVKDVRQLTESYKNDAKCEDDSSMKSSVRKAVHVRSTGSSGSGNSSGSGSSSSGSGGGGYRSAGEKLKWPCSSSTSPLWNDEQRVGCSKSFVKDNILNSRLFKRRQAIPLFQAEDSNDTTENFITKSTTKSEDKNVKDDNININGSTFPIILIRKDLKNFSSKRMKAKKKTPFLGFDIILPTGFGSAVWRAFQFAGARAIGIDELHSIQLDYGVASFPRDFPDTEAGQEYWKEKEHNLSALDNKRPPLKRVGRSGLDVPCWDGILWDRWDGDNDGDSDNNLNNDNQEIIEGEIDIDKMDVNKPEIMEIENVGIIVGDVEVLTDHTTEAAESVRKNEQRINFNVVREEKYVNLFRVESVSRTDGDNVRDVNKAFFYSMMDFRNIMERSLKEEDNNEEFYNKNDALFYSLMKNLVLKSPLHLPLQTMISVLLVPTGRGVCRDGAVIFMPSKDDILEYAYYTEKKSDNSLSSFRQSNKRLGEWRGVDFNTPEPSVHRKCSEVIQETVTTNAKDLVDGVVTHKYSQIPEIDDQNNKKCSDNDKTVNLNAGVDRVVIGYVTSGRYSGSHCGAPSIGLCDITRLQDMNIAAAHLLLEYQGIGNVGSRSPPRGRVLSLVMFMSPRSKWLRPALIDIISLVP